MTLRLWQLLKPRLVAERVTTVYETLERPLVPVLGAHGAARHRDRPAGPVAALRRVRPARRRARGGRSTSSPASRSIPAAPSSSATSCSARSGLPGGTKTKTGAWSTGARVLEELAEQGHELPRKILDWRQVVEAATRPTPTRCPATSIRRPTACTPPTRSPPTPTGRLSSSEPNLQNIPIRTEEGRKIRRAFIADARHKLVSADYSQIELRLLAEIADIPALKQRLPRRARHPRHDRLGDVRRAGEGHARRSAPARQGDQLRHHLRHLGVRARQSARHRARGGRRLYQEVLRALPRHPRLHGRDQGVLPSKNGYVLTLFGRKCHYPDIAASNASIRAFNERAAINARLQGTAADIIRRAMIRMDAALAEAEAQRADAAAGARRARVRGAGRRGREDAAGGRGGDGGRPACRRSSLSVPLAGRRARRAQLGRGALRPFASNHSIIIIRAGG